MDKLKMAGLHCLIINVRKLKMKKAMLFIIALMFSVSASAASLNLSTFDQDIDTNATNNALYDNTSQAVSFNTIDSAGSFTLGHHLVSAEDVTVNVEWTFNKQANFLSGDITKGGSLVFVQSVTGAGYSFVMSLLAGVDYYFDVTGISGGNPLTATLTVSAVPVPAALFLFAPALLGFLGLRRKSASAVAA